MKKTTGMWEQLFIFVIHKTRKNTEMTFTFALALLSCLQGAPATDRAADLTARQDQTYVSRRPTADARLFHSEAVEKEIKRVLKVLKHPYLAWMFENCYPNTIDTTVHFFGDEGSGDDDTYVITGDINAMWLRDTSAQVYPYLQLAKKDKRLQRMLRGVIRRQTRYLLQDPYANAFYGHGGKAEHADDNTEMKPGVFERKYELDSLCYPLFLAYAYLQATGDLSVFDATWVEAVKTILRTMREQQRKEGPRTSYRFTRRTHAMHDTQSNSGYGHPAKPCGLIASSFRPSDDCTVFPYLVPSNFFAVSVLEKAAKILDRISNPALAADCRTLAAEVSSALQKYAVVEHPKYGKIYAFEVDGYGSQLLMDDANAPGLLSLPFLDCMPASDPIYQNTRRFVWSEDNPYFFHGTAGEGIGGPHIGYDMVWPMSIIIKAYTADNDDEIARCLTQIMNTDAGLGFIHESFNKDNPERFTRSWMAWANTIFGQLIVKLIDDGKASLLNSLPMPNHMPKPVETKKN